jgi:hypothetical protein
MLNARIAAVALCAIFVTEQARSANYLLTGGVYKKNSAGGSATYSFALDLQQWLGNDSNISLELISPNGTRFGESVTSFNWVHIFLDDVLEADLNTTTTGTWTIEETLSGSEINEYQFTVPSLLNSSNFRGTPLITSPSDGAVVDKMFNLTWSNGVPNAYGLGISFANDQSFPFPDVKLNSTGNATISYENVSGIGGATISELRVSTSRNIQELKQVVPVSPGANSTFNGPGFGTLAGLFSYKTYSPPINLTIVPEPTAFVLVGIALLCATGGRGFVRGDG